MGTLHLHNKPHARLWEGRALIGGKPSGHGEFRRRMDFPLDLGTFVGDRLAQIILGLKADQKTGGDTKIALETQRGIRRDALSSVENVAETAARDGHVPGG